jgi:hypothetical protein
MQQRGISEEQIHAALAHETRRTPGEPGTMWIHGLVTSGRILKVRVSVDNEAIITAAWPD